MVGGTVVGVGNGFAKCLKLRTSLWSSDCRWVLTVASSIGKAVVEQRLLDISCNGIEAMADTDDVAVVNRPAKYRLSGRFVLSIRPTGGKHICIMGMARLVVNRNSVASGHALGTERLEPIEHRMISIRSPEEKASFLAINGFDSVWFM
ncbi:hypothetical protein [Haloarcula amylovorans]|uniref:hypothetical protein n=1 Tax=Haloarcula amylovorans TaxID=2562280 RepID=UPI001FD736C4|nr:hypothetical protein [Halomicroarcula amylolytica]